MKPTCLAITAFASALILTASSQSSWCADRLAGIEALAAPHSDVSSRKTVRRKAPVQRRAYVVDSRSPYYLRPGVRPSFGYIGPPGYAGEYAWRKSIGQCVEDLGYGRWSACGNR